MAPASGRFARLVLLALAAGLALVVLTLAWPRVYAALRYLPVDHAIAGYYRGEAITSERLPVLLRFAEEALSRHDHYRYRDGLSLLYYLRGVDINTPALERRDAYRQSAAEAEQSLAQAPAQPATWLRLGTVRWILRAEQPEILSAWRMSVYTSRTESTLYAARVDMGLALGQHGQRGARHAGRPVAARLA